MKRDFKMNLSHGQSIVLRNHLANYPEDVPFEWILEMIESGSSEVSMWHYFESWHPETFVLHLRNLARSIDSAIVEVKNEC